MPSIRVSAAAGGSSPAQLQSALGLTASSCSSTVGLVWAALILLTAVGCSVDRGGLADPTLSDGGPLFDASDARLGESHDSDVEADAPTAEPDGGCEPDGAEPELCDGIDNDCDPTSADGADEPWAGAACDGPDSDLCPEGTAACEGARMVCSDSTGDTADLCDGADNDCNPATADGSGEPWFDTACDGPDGDSCAEGSLGCAAGAMTCSDTSDTTEEICDGVDNDCDGEIDEEGASGGSRWYADGDGDGHGSDTTFEDRCAGGPGWAASGGDCDDTDAAIHPGASEACDGEDDNCDGVIDEGASCGCTMRHRDGHTYLFCSSNRVWTSARDYCRARGYELVTIDDSDENTWLTGEALAIEDGDWWIGLTDRGSEGSFRWVSGSGAGYRNWDFGEPNNFFGEDCVVLLNAPDRGQWNDVDCGDSYPFVCEAGP